MTDEAKPKAEKKEVKSAQVIEIATQVERLIELEDGTRLDLLEAITLLINQQREIMRRI